MKCKILDKISIFQLLVILVLSFSILIAIFYPTLSQYVLKQRRRESISIIYDIQKALEAQYAENKTYAPDKIKLVENHHYYFSITGDLNTYKIMASARGAQGRDKPCEILTLNNKGEKGPIKHPECWQ